METINIFNPPNNNTKALSIVILLSFLAALLGGGYAVSAEKGKISEDEFTISQALGNGNKYIMITFFVITLISSILLTYMRGGPLISLYSRIFLYLLAYSLIIVIMWVTVPKDKALHFKFAGTIFTAQLLVVLIITYLFNRYLDCHDKRLIVLDYNLILIFSSFILLLVFGIFDEDDKSEFRNVIFASNENITVLLNLIPILYLGFI